MLLGISATAAEHLASDMIEQGRMNASIDQIEGVVEFRSGESGGGSLATWDSQIQDLCLVVNHTLEDINKQYPGMGYAY